VKIVFLALSLFFILGCSSKKPLYYYGDYSNAYYEDKKELSPQTRTHLLHSIDEAIEKAPQGTSARVAPGLYANLGYLYLKAGQNKKAIENFEKEKALYPESSKFMDRIIQKIKALEEKNDETK